MTPFGLKMRSLRRQKGVNQKQMAKDIGVSAAYLSALEHGHRGVPSWQLLQRIIGYFNIIWDEEEELRRLAEMSHTRVVVDTENLSAAATSLANFLANEIHKLSEEDCKTLRMEIAKRAVRQRSLQD
ncbi:MAG: helix-turn-helix domain-containing protein [Pseudomonadota bacterium]